MAAAMSPREPSELQRDAEGDGCALLDTNPTPFEKSAPTRSRPSRALLAAAAAAAAVLLLGGAALHGGSEGGGPGAGARAGPARGLLADAELRRALLDAVAAAGGGRPVGAEAAAAPVGGARGPPPRELRGPGADATQRARLLRVVRHLRNLSLRSSRRLSSPWWCAWCGDGAGEAGVYEFECSNEDGPGTGELGSAGDPDDENGVSDVVVRTGDLPLANMTSMNFTIGPPVGEGDEHLIAGRMDVLHASPEGLSGNITAGFINLRSTLKGTWESGADGLGGPLQIHLSEPDLYMEEDWTWEPSGSVSA